MSKNKKNINDDEEIILRIITLGNAGVGKTSIIKRYVKNIFEENHTLEVLCVFHKEVVLSNNKIIKLRIFDTFGQEKYKGISKSYCKGAEGVFFVFALNDKDSLIALRDWIKIFNENNLKDNIPKYLIGNKCDIEKEIDENIINEFSIANNLKYFETSAKTNECINNIFEDIAQMMYENYENSYKKMQNFIKIDYRHTARLHKRTCCDNNNY